MDQRIINALLALRKQELQEYREGKEDKQCQSSHSH